MFRTTQLVGFGSKVAAAGGAGGGPLTYQNSSLPVFSSSTNVDVNYPSGIQSGDLLVIVVTSRGAHSASATGFTAAHTATVTGRGATFLWKVADGTESGSINVSGLGASPSGGSMHRFTGASDTGTTPFYGANDDVGASTTTPPMPIVTTQTDGDGVIAAYVHTNDDPIPTTPASGYTEIADSGTTLSIDVSHFSMFSILPTAQTTDTGVQPTFSLGRPWLAIAAAVKTAG